MSVFAPNASQISAREPRARRSQFRGRQTAFCFRLMSPRNVIVKRRDALTAMVSGYKAPNRDKPVPGRYCAVRAILAIMILCTAFAAGQARAQASAATQASADTIAHGKALTEAADCAGCHTADPAKPFAGGKRIDTPLGGIYAPNLTPDRETGLGGWSDDQFYRALHQGVAPDGSRYYPAFPYPNFTKLIRDDVLAIRAYLATLAPIRNVRPPSQLYWPLNYRVVMRVWNWLFFRPGIFGP